MKTTMMKVALRGASARMSSVAHAGRVALVGAMVAAAAPFVSSCDPEPDPVPDPAALSVNKSSIPATADSGTYTVSITANVAWTAASSEAWAVPTPASGSGSSDSQTISVAVAPNTGAERLATVTITAGDKAEAVVVTQAAAGAVPDKTYVLTVQLTTETGLSLADIPVTVSSADTSVQAPTNGTGAATFTLPAGTYTAGATTTTAANLVLWRHSGSKEITLATDTIVTETLALTTANAGSQVVIKELYFSALPNDTGKNFNDGQYTVLYNNSNLAASLQDVCFATALPANGHGPVNAAYQDHEAEGWLSAGWGIFAIESNVTLAPYEQIVVGLTKTVDQTAKPYQSNGVNLDKPEYYAQYDPASGFNNATGHPAPSNIPDEHYLKGYKTGTSPSWTFSVNSPAFFIFKPQGTTPGAFAADAGSIAGTSANTVSKVPEAWVVDGIEVYSHANLAASTHKRINTVVDAGYVDFTIDKGYSVYRNVDKEATEAIAANVGKLVYSYAGGAESSTDPSGIDAEASLAAGARIIYTDSNNSTNDFHQRSKASLKD